MKLTTKFISSLFLFLSLSSLTDAQQGVIVQGIILDSPEEFTILSHSPRMRGNINFDGFRSIGTEVDSDGKFKLESPTVVHSGSYRLFFPQHMVGLHLFEGDSINLEIFLENPDKTHASGNGAGKINVWNQAQFSYEYFDFSIKRNLQQFDSYIDSIIDYRLALLDAIYSKSVHKSVIKEAPNQDYLERIIKETPISTEEYNFLTTLVEHERYSLINRFISDPDIRIEEDADVLDLTDRIFGFYNSSRYQNLANINHPYLYNSLENIVQIEYLKERQIKERDTITFGNWRTKFQSDGYMGWCAKFLTNNFNTEILLQYYSQPAAGLMTWGIDNTSILKYLSLDNDNKYVERIKTFSALLDNGLLDNNYNLGDESKTLDKDKFDKLLQSCKQKTTIIAFWSAQAAGASIIDELPSLKAFELHYHGKVNVVYICVDRLENKALWGARIIDESWAGDHYFLPLEGDANRVEGITDKEISSLCSGGASYILISENGNNISEIKGPFYLNKREKDKL